MKYKCINGDVIEEHQVFRCKTCGKMMSGKTLIQQQTMFENMIAGNQCDIQSSNDFLHRECPLCKVIGRIMKNEMSRR